MLKIHKMKTSNRFPDEVQMTSSHQFTKDQELLKKANPSYVEALEQRINR